MSHLSVHRWRVKVFTRPWESWICCSTTLRHIWLPRGTGHVWPLLEYLTDLTCGLVHLREEEQSFILHSFVFNSVIFCECCQTMILFCELSELTSLLLWDLCLLFCPEDKFPDHIASYTYEVTTHTATWNNVIFIFFFIFELISIYFDWICICYRLINELLNMRDSSGFIS